MNTQLATKKRLIYFQIGILLSILLAQTGLLAQRDSLVFDNGVFLIGEIEGLDRGVLKIDVEFGDKDFEIEWDAVREIYTEHQYLISLSDGHQYNGTIEGKADSLVIDSYAQGKAMVKRDEIVYLYEIEEGFFSRLSASIDVGFSVTKANNLIQFTSRSSIGYEARRWMAFGSINSLISEQDDQVERTKRTDAVLNFKYVLQKGWFILPEVNFLSNTEQSLRLRTTARLGPGYFFFRTNRAYFSASAGLAFTSEDFRNDTPDRNSTEGFLSTDLNLYDIGDLSFLLKATGYPSISESGRFRADVNFDIKLDLPLDFYIKAGTTYNFDNQPAAGASQSDYVVQTGVGWEL